MSSEILDKKEIERALEALANLGHYPKELRRFQKVYRKFFPDRFLRDSPLLRVSREMEAKYIGDSVHVPTGLEIDEEQSLAHLTELRWILRKAWREADPRLRIYYAFDLSRRFHNMMNPDHQNEPPEATPFELAVDYFRRNHQRARYCQNPECFTPYYFSTHLKPTRFCNPKCAGPTQKANKLQWWNDHKEEILAKRKATRKKKSQRKPTQKEKTRGPRQTR